MTKLSLTLWVDRLKHDRLLAALIGCTTDTAWGALVYGEAQCSGYARAMKALCDGIGIGCYYVHADSSSANPSHQWNEVCINGNWYIIDVQANDLSGFYAFFLVSDSTYAGMTGMSWDRSSVPACPKNYS